MTAKKKRRLTKKQETGQNDCKEETGKSREGGKREKCCLQTEKIMIAINWHLDWQEGVDGACMCSTGWYLQQECRSAMVGMCHTASCQPPQHKYTKTEPQHYQNKGKKAHRACSTNDYFKTTTTNFIFALILLTPVDGSTEKILMWPACAFVLEASDRKIQLNSNTIFLFNSAVCGTHSDEVTYLFVAE